MNVTDCKFLGLSATPLLNRPFELGIMFNLLKGIYLDRGQKLTLFPEVSREFNALYVDPDHFRVMDPDDFIRRIQGMVSYYFAGEGQIFPEIVCTKIINCEFSPRQLDIYLAIRQIEMKKEAAAKKKLKEQTVNLTLMEQETLEDNMSTFRVYSRLCSNFVFPVGLNRPGFPTIDDLETPQIESMIEFLVELLHLENIQGDTRIKTLR